jgi:hypothetical protein
MEKEEEREVGTMEKGLDLFFEAALNLWGRSTVPQGTVSIAKYLLGDRQHSGARVVGVRKDCGSLDSCDVKEPACSSGRRDTT